MALNKNNKLIILLAIFFVAIFAVLVVYTSPWKTLAVVLSIILIFLALYEPKSIIIFLAVYIPLEPFFLKFVPDEIYIYARYFSEGLIYILLLSVGIKVLARRRKIIRTPIDWPLILFIVVALISIIVNFVPLQISFLGLRQILRFILLFYIIVYLRPGRNFIKRVVALMLILVFIESFIGVAQAVIGEPADRFLIPGERKFFESIQLTTGTVQTWESGQRVFATLGRYDQLGTFVCFWMLILLGIIYELGKKVSPQNRGVYWFIFLVAGATLLLTYSRASWFGFLLGLIFIAVFVKRDRRVMAALAGLVIIAFSYLLYSGLLVYHLTASPNQTLVERFYESFSYERWRSEYYGLGRLYFIVNTPAVVIARYPLFGVGPGQYGGGAVAALHNTTKYDELNLPFGVYGTEGYIDNNWFSILGETGILGLAAYGAMFVFLFRYAYQFHWKSRKAFDRGLALGFLGCILALTLQAFLGQFLEVRTLAFYFWLVAGFIVVLGMREEEENSTLPMAGVRGNSVS